jgi:hypothetical protein
MADDIPLPFALPAVARKKGRRRFWRQADHLRPNPTLLARAERRTRLADQLAAATPDDRDASPVIRLLTWPDS